MSGLDGQHRVSPVRGLRRTRVGTLARLVMPGVLALALAGCAAGPEDEPPADDTATSATPEDSETDEPADDTEDSDDDAEGSDDGATAVQVGTTSLGEVLVDAEGMTLYMFDPDEQGESTCYDDCAAAWPPLLTDGSPSAGEGADDALLGTVERTDGTQQVTYDGWPLYFFAQDAAEGDVNGQSLNGVWWVLDADGTPVRD